MIIFMQLYMLHNPKCNLHDSMPEGIQLNSYIPTQLQIKYSF